MKLRFALGLTTALAAGAAHGAVVTYDFEGLSTAAYVDITTNHQGYAGLTWTPDDNWVLVSAGSFPTPALSGSYALVNNRGANPAIVSGGSFDFDGVSAIGWSFGAPSRIGVRAFDASSGLIGDTGLIAINGTSYTDITAGFLGVSRLEFYGGGFFVIDDLRLGMRSSDVPLPGTLSLALVGVGLAGAASRLRKRA